MEEHIDPALWFTDQEGPWEWKGQLASARKCVYGKFIRNKASIRPTFFGWLFQYAGKMTLAGPPEVIEQYNKHKKKAMKGPKEN